MGLKKYVKGEGGNWTFADLKGDSGKFVVKDRESGAIEEYDRLEGLITAIAPYENVTEQYGTIRGIKLKIEDGEGQPVQLSFTLGSFLAGKFAGLLNAADLSKPIALQVGKTNKGDKIGNETATSTFVWLTAKQDGVKLKHSYVGADGQAVESLPDAPPLLDGKGRPVMNGNKPKVDMSGVEDMTNDTLLSVFQKFAALHETEGAPVDEGVDPAEAHQAAERARG